MSAKEIIFLVSDTPAMIRLLNIVRREVSTKGNYIKMVMGWKGYHCTDWKARQGRSNHSYQH